MNDWIKVALYNAWLLQMNINGYGSCNQIDKLVRKGELTPGKEYDKISKVPNAKLTRAHFEL